MGKAKNIKTARNRVAVQKNTHTGILNNKNLDKIFGYMEKTKSRQAGITLVALIVTVIVLLILAGVTLNFLLGENGLLNKSETAYKTHIAGKEKEAIQMALADLEIAKVNGEIEEITAYILEKHLKEDGYSVSVVLEEGVFLITFIESHNIYVVDQIGNVEPSERYNINYNLNGGTNPPEQPQTYQRGETVGLLYPTKEGQAFEGWYETSDFSGERITEIRNRKEDITVYANWVEETDQSYFKWSTDGTTITGLNGNTRTQIVIPKTHILNDGTVVDVTTIGASAFSGHSEITDLKLQKIITLGQYACRNCTGLESIEIPKSINSSEWNGVFSGCTNLKTVTFEEGTAQVAPSIFANCPGLLEVYLPESVEKIGKASFENSGIVKLNMTDSFKEAKNGKIDANAFKNCKNLIEVKMSHTITTLEQFAFRNCTGLESIEIPKSINSSEWNGVFSGCTNLKTVTFEEGTAQVAPSIFANCPGLLEVYLPESVEKIGKASFENSGIVKLNMTDSFKEAKNGKIDAIAFENCKNLKEVKISNTITMLDDYAFGNCIGLEDIEIPKSINECSYCGNNGVFTGCTNLKNVSFEEGMKKVPKYMFWKCGGPLEVSLPESVTTIEEGAFSNSGITQITFPTSLKTISSNAFKTCSSLSTVNYRGNEIAWGTISIAGGNDAIKSITPVYNYID